MTSLMIFSHCFRSIVQLFVCNEKPDYSLEKYPFNYSRNSDFVSFLMNITSTSSKLWFDERNAEWQGDKNPKFVKTLTKNGIGFTFNTFDADEHLNANM